MSLLEQAHDEKRNYIRMRIDTAVTFSKNDSSELYEGRCQDLSGAGMLLETDKKLVAGDRLKVTIPSSDSNFTALNAVAEVARVEAIPELHKFRYGLAIRNISE